MDISSPTGALVTLVDVPRGTSKLFLRSAEVGVKQTGDDDPDRNGRAFVSNAIPVCMYVCIYMYVYIYIYLYVYVYTYVYM